MYVYGLLKQPLKVSKAVKLVSVTMYMGMYLYSDVKVTVR